MGKRESENPCSVCEHYHKHEEGETCGICGHCLLDPSDRVDPQLLVWDFPSEILPEFLYLGSYDNAARAVHLRTQGISRVLNTVPMCRNPYMGRFTYHNLDNEQVLQFNDAIEFLDKCEKDKARVLVHCMFGKIRSPAIVIAYLMKRKGWRLAESHQWVKQRRPKIDISPEFYQQLEEFEQTIFGSGMMSAIQNNDAPTFGFGFPNDNNQAQAPVLNNAPTSVFSSPASSIPSQEFTFGAAPPKATTGGDIAMDSS